MLAGRGKENVPQLRINLSPAPSLPGLLKGSSCCLRVFNKLREDSPNFFKLCFAVAEVTVVGVLCRSKVRMPGDSVGSVVPLATSTCRPGYMAPWGRRRLFCGTVADSYCRIFPPSPGARIVPPNSDFRTFRTDGGNCQIFPLIFLRADTYDQFQVTSLSYRLPPYIYWVLPRPLFSIPPFLKICKSFTPAPCTRKKDSNLSAPTEIHPSGRAAKGPRMESVGNASRTTTIIPSSSWRNYQPNSPITLADHVSPGSRLPTFVPLSAD